MARTGGPDDRPPRIDDRDMAVLRLREAYAEGHLSHEELDGRLHQVLSATTYGGLMSALAGLPESAGTTATIAAEAPRHQVPLSGTS